MFCSGNIYVFQLIDIFLLYGWLNKTCCYIQSQTKYFQWHVKLSKILFLPPLKIGFQCIYCNEELYYLILNCTTRPRIDGGKTSDSAIILRDNTGSDILIDIIISLESNLPPSRLKRTTIHSKLMLMFYVGLWWCPSIMPIACTRLILFFLFFPEI